MTEHFTLNEFLRSDTASRYKIDNTPNKEQLENIEFVGGRNEGSSSPMSNNAYMDAPSEAPMDVMPEYDIPKSDPYENYDKEVSLSDNDLPF